MTPPAESRPLIGDFDTMLQEELEQLRLRRKHVLGMASPSANQNGIAQAHEFRPLGLGLSGGGIRSATLNLGILQGLASHGLLPYVDYLSTVSGGGFIGTWLHGVIKRQHRGDPEKAAVAINPENHTDSFGDAERDPVTFLRMYSNYLAPRPGLLSADSWLIAVIWIRNMFLNQLILIPALCAGMLAIVLACVALCAGSSIPHPIVLSIAPLFFFVVVASANIRAIAEQEFTDIKRLPYPRQLLKAWPGILAVIASAFFAFAAHWDLSNAGWYSFVLFLYFLGLFMLLQGLGGFLECFNRRHKGQEPLGIFLLVLFPLVAAAATVGLVYGAFWLLAGHYATLASAVWGPPLLIMAMSAGVIFHIGLMGSDFTDASREWLARAGAILSILCFAWVVVAGICLYGPFWVSWLTLQYGTMALGALAGWVGISVTGAKFASGPSTSGAGEERGSTGKEFLAQIAPVVFVLGLLILLATVVHLGLAFGQQKTLAQALALFVRSYGETLSHVTLNHWYPWLFLILLALPALLLPLRFNINEFSLLHFYKNRLVRCYLGAGNIGDRKPNAFTGFDPRDDFPIASLLPVGKEPYYGPYAIVNTALNTNIGAEMGRQERKASSFVFTPLRCGFVAPQTRRDRKEVQAFSRLDQNAFRLTKGFLYPSGPDIGTVTGISGAAANPNSGYHTSAAVAFLLTWFSVRLGWWVGNPRIRCAADAQCPPDRPGPLYSISWLFKELLAQTTARSDYLNLSDGGHFDNIGLYELVRRRCRYIIIGDGEADPELTFESLGGAIRKCRADFDVDIDIDIDRIRAEKGFSRTHCVVGQIVYPEITAETNHRFTPKGQVQTGKCRGWILYLKSSVTGDEPEDIKQYKSSHPAFPHDPTANQFFTESLFESYRSLGYHVVKTAFENAEHAVPPAGQPEFLDPLFQDLAALWYPPAILPAGAASKHADAYTALMAQLSGNADLQFLEPEINGGSPVISPQLTPQLQLTVKFFLLELIQLMENVWFDFQLESRSNRDNPNNSGWLTVFKRWSGGNQFQSVWASEAKNYNPLFQKFVKDVQQSDF